MWFAARPTLLWLSQLVPTLIIFLATPANPRRVQESQEGPIKPVGHLRSSSRETSAHLSHSLDARILIFRLTSSWRSSLTRLPGTRLATRLNSYWRGTNNPGRFLSRGVLTRKHSLKTTSYSASIKRSSPFSQCFVEKLLNSPEWKSLKKKNYVL